MRFVIALRPRDFPLPRWLLRIYQVGFAGVCV